MKLRDEHNFMICPFNNISSGRNYSVGKVRVLTSKRRWTNEIVNVLANGITYTVGVVDKILSPIEIVNVFANGITYTVGVVEYTDDWSPFKLLSFDKVESESDDDGEEIDDEDQAEKEDFVSDTYMHEDEEVEEGEFKP
ncbi:hypothetical protein LXL04_022705 [Taraxacum kok-saghyz]